MALVRGKPQLAVWSNTDNRLRLFELNGSDVFEAITDWELIPLTTGGTEPSYDNNLKYLRMGFYRDYFWTHIRTGLSAGDGLLETYNKASKLSTVNAEVVGQRLNVGLMEYHYSKESGYMFMGYSGVAATSYAVKMNESGIATAIRNITTSGSLPMDAWCYSAIAPKDEYTLFFGRNQAYIVTSDRIGYTTEGAPTFNPYNVPPTNQQIPIPASTSLLNGRVTFTPDGKFSVLLQRLAASETGNIIMMKYNAQALPAQKFETSITEVAGNPVTAKFHPSGRFLLIGTRNVAGTTWKLEVYRRMGLFLQLLQTITDAGRSIDITQDGRFIIDTLSHKAWDFNNGTLTENATILANVPTGITIQALSDHVDILGQSSTYDIAVEFSAREDVASLSLKIVPLVDAATFDASDVTLDDVTDSGALAIVTTEFPSGGVAITTTAIALSTSGVWDLKGQDLDVLVKDPISFRKAVIYDTVTSMPVKFIDFGKTIEPAKDTTVRFSLSEFPLLSYVVSN